MQSWKDSYCQLFMLSGETPYRNMERRRSNRPGNSQANEPITFFKTLKSCWSLSTNTPKEQVNNSIFANLSGPEQRGLL